MRNIFCKFGGHFCPSCSIVDLKVKEPICIACNARRAKYRSEERRTFTPDRENPALPSRTFRMILI